MLPSFEVINKSIQQLTWFRSAAPKLFDQLDQGALDIAWNIIYTWKQSYSIQPPDSVSPLHRQEAYDQYQAIIALMAANMQIQDTWTSWTFLRGAILSESPQVLEDLLKANPQAVNYQDKSSKLDNYDYSPRGQSVFMLAVLLADIRCIKICFEHSKPDLTLKDNDGNTALDLAYGPSSKYADISDTIIPVTIKPEETAEELRVKRENLVTALRSTGAKTAAELNADVNIAVSNTITSTPVPVSLPIATVPHPQLANTENQPDISARIASVDKKIEQARVLNRAHGTHFQQAFLIWPNRLKQPCSSADVDNAEQQYNDVMKNLAFDTGLQGWNPLHLAASHGLDEVVSDLLAAGAAVNAPAHSGQTALGYAQPGRSTSECSNFENTVKILKAAGGLTGVELAARPPAPAILTTTTTPSASTPAPVILTTTLSSSSSKQQNDDNSEISSPRNSTDSVGEMVNIPLSSIKRKSNAVVEDANTHLTPKAPKLKAVAKWISAAFDYNNRMLFEGLFDFVFNRKATWEAYQEDEYGVKRSYPKTRYVLGFFARLFLLPLTSLVYNLSRILLIVLNLKAAYQHNAAKTMLMTTVTVAATATLLTVGLLTPFFTQTSLQLLSGVATGLAASVGSAIIVGALLSIGLSLLLHGAKKVAQSWNEDIVEGVSTCHTYYTAPKHSINNSMEYNGYCNPLLELHISTLTLYYDHHKKPAICGVSEAAKDKKAILDLIRKTTSTPEKYQEDYDAIRAKVTDPKLGPELDQYEIIDQRIGFKGYSALRS